MLEIKQIRSLQEILDHIVATTTIGIPSDSTYDDGFFKDWTENTTIANAVDDINKLLLKLAPIPPLNLSDRYLLINNIYTAKESGTGISHVDCIDSNIPYINVSGTFYDGDRGILTAYIDGTNVGTKILTFNDDSGIYDSLVIQSDSDPYIGEPGEGIYKELEAYIYPDTPLTYAVHVAYLEHTITGTTGLLYFHCDNPQTTYINTVSAILPVTLTRYISGVPSLLAGDNILLNYNILNAVRKHYVDNISYLSGTEITPIDYSVSSIPTEGSVVSMTNKSVTLLDNVYSENVIISIQGRNSKSILGVIYNYTTNSRIDTISDETTRVLAGSGEFPVAGYGGIYNSNLSLKTIYTEELQLLNGLYQRPTLNFSSNLPVAGPDYSSGMGTDYRYILFESETLVDTTSFTLEILNTEGTWSGIETTGIRIYIKVEGITGWLNGNLSYSGVGNPINDNDAAMVYSESTETIKQITFGSITRSGLLYIRIGLPISSDKKFSGININNIV